MVSGAVGAKKVRQKILYATGGGFKKRASFFHPPNLLSVGVSDFAKGRGDPKHSTVKRKIDEDEILKTKYSQPRRRNTHSLEDEILEDEILEDEILSSSL